MATDAANLLVGDLLLEAEARLNEAIGIARNGDLDTARAVADMQVDAFPDELRVLHKAGVIMRICGDHDAALALFGRALAAYPRFHFTEIEIANVHAELGDKEEALRWYRQAIDSCPDHPFAYLRAAKLERELRRAWAGLLLLERLHERVPRHVEGNVLRAEFLLYHGKRPEAARAYEAAVIAGCDDAMEHYMRVLTEIADYRGVLACAACRAPAARSSLEFHVAVLSGHAKLALAIDHVHSLATLAARERSSAWLNAERLVARLQAAIHSRVPLSMIRVGDGEARFVTLGDPWVRDLISPHEKECIVSLIWQNWFGEPIGAANVADLESLSKMFADALMDADILGVTTVQRYEIDTSHRGYLGVLERTVSEVLAAHNDVLLTDALVHIDLHRRSAFYGELLSGLDFLGCISPHPGLAARLALYHGVHTFCEYIVPGESRLPKAARGRSFAPHFPDRFREVMSCVRVPRQGAVFLVAAGLLGKVYCNRIRQLGGIAVDIGSIADAWMGFNTRPGQFDEPDKWVLPESPTTTEKSLELHQIVPHRVV